MLLNVFHWIRCSFNNWRKIDKLYGTKSAILYALRTACKDFFFTKPIRYRHNSCIFKTLTQIKLFYSHKFSVWRENIIVTLVFCWKNCWWFYKKKKHATKYLQVYCSCFIVNMLMKYRKKIRLKTAFKIAMTSQITTIVLYSISSVCKLRTHR